MSTSLPEPENAAPIAPVRPEQAPEPAHHTDRNNVRRGFAQRKPSSLLSRPLSPSSQVGEPNGFTAGPVEVPKTVANTDSSCSAGVSGNSLDDTCTQDIPEYSMATTMPPTKPLALSAGATPALPSIEFDISDIKQVNSLLNGHRDLLKSRHSRGTSLERTEKEKRVQDHSKPVFSHNPGDTGMTNSPAHRGPNAAVISSDNLFLDGFRASYRSWRDAHPGITAEKAWSYREQTSGEVPEGQVEKSVAEVLAGIEPNNRSRKASHSLRFFREGLPEEKPKRREAHEHDTGRVHDLSNRMDNLIPRDSGKVDSGKTTNFQDEPGDFSTSPGIITPISTFKGAEHNGETTKIPKIAPPQASKKLNALPTQLLDDLRKQHNLMPAPSIGFSFSHSLPVAESERAKTSNESPQVTAGNGANGINTENKTATKDEDDESGEEKISSALFVPHKTSHDLPEREVLGREFQDQSGPLAQQTDRTDSDGWLVAHEVPPRIGDETVVGKASPHDLLEAVHDQTPEQDHNNYFPDSLQSPDLPYDAISEAGYSTKDEESSFTDDTETTPTIRGDGKHNITESQQDHLHRHQKKAKAPLEAIELIPYRHQVGGHTTMWRFSKRAVCKQLNNRENEFYERIERYHPKLLKFMPRYIGVLNVTFEKQQKRKASGKESGATADSDPARPGFSEHNSSNIVGGAADLVKLLHGDDRNCGSPRLVSQSINSGQTPTPTVTFADNRHIIPKSFQQPSLEDQEAVRRYLRQGYIVDSLHTRRSSQSQPPPSNGEFTVRPNFTDKQATSWGATTVNKKLRNEVFGEAFLQQPIPIHRHRRTAHQTRPLAHRLEQSSNTSQLRTSNSESNLVNAQEDQSATIENDNAMENKVQQQSIKGTAGHNSETSLSADGSPMASSSVRSTQVGDQQVSSGSDNQIEEEVISNQLTLNPMIEPNKTKRKRRYSSGSLRRKPDEDAEVRGDLKYFEEADDATYKSRRERDIFNVDSDVRIGGNGLTSHPPNLDKAKESPPEIEASNLFVPLPKVQQAGLSMLPKGEKPVMNGIISMPRPVNPKEAQTQRDKRVEFFLLLEDLTAGMKRPCIMDLKMGTRQYGVDANEKKRISQRRKCAETTSKELGVRVCGLQVWNVKKQSYIFQDKYFGRKLKAGREFQDALQRFLFDGVEYASVLRHIPTILHKLSELEVLVKDLRGYRFYAASLLMFYDGEVENEGPSKDASTMTKVSKGRMREIDFKIADFANCVTAEPGLSALKERACPPQHPNEPDKGFLRGLKSLRRYFIRIEKEVAEIGMRRITDINEAENVIPNGHGRTDDLLDDDLGDVSY